MVLALVVLIAATAALMVYTHWVVPALVGLGAVTAVVLFVWVCERFAVRERRPALSAVLFGVCANVLAAGVNVRWFLVPAGAKNDSAASWPFLVSLLVLTAVPGLVLAVRAMVRARGMWKSLGVIGVLLSLTPAWSYALVLDYVSTLRGLVDK